jgi:hypothetical protein
MSTARGFLAFLYDFLVGDDPLIAAAVVAALALTAALAALGVSAWWVPPTAVVATLALSLTRATRSRASLGAHPVPSSVPGDATRAPKVDPRA